MITNTPALPAVGPAGSGLTVGVEEEFLLLDPVTGRPVPAARHVLRRLAGDPRFQAELFQFQLEIATRVCADLAAVRTELTSLRRLAAAAAQAVGCRLVASGTSAWETPGLSALTDDPRYRELARRYPAVTADYGTCGCHVHVGVPSRDLGVGVLARLRPWLAQLLAISANSPIADGRDTGAASRRYDIQSRWPTARPPAVWPDSARYDATVRRLIDSGAAIDDRSVYFLARLSPRYPTVEVRVADVCLDLDTTVLVAALTRAIVATALRESQDGAPLRRARTRWIVAGLADAARYGLSGPGTDPFTGGRVPQRVLLCRLIHHVRAALDDSGDRATVGRLVGRLVARGTGADRQRIAWTDATSAGDYVDALAAATAPRDRPRGHGAADPTGSRQARRAIRRRDRTAPMLSPRHSGGRVDSG
jgi:carboxylate-amine ligase